MTDKKEEIIEFVHKVNGSEHLLFLWKNQESKDEFVSEFFNKEFSGNSKGFVSVKPYQDESVENIGARSSSYCETIRGCQIGRVENSHFPRP